VPVIGVNKFATVGEAHAEPDLELTTADPKGAQEAKARVERVRRERDGAQARAALEKLSRAAAGPDNLQPYVREAVAAYCTLGEIASVFRERFGDYHPPTRF
jgi:methylmalonyl-CoA mutase N-terminal domain/subunit